MSFSLPGGHVKPCYPCSGSRIEKTVLGDGWCYMLYLQTHCFVILIFQEKKRHLILFFLSLTPSLLLNYFKYIVFLHNIT